MANQDKKAKYYDDYIRWLADQFEINIQEMTGACLLWKQLRAIKYYWVHPKDENMPKNVTRWGREKYYLAHEDTIGDYMSMAEFDEIDTPNVLEVLTSFARRMEDCYMWSPTEGDRAYLWFGIFLQNLGIEQYVYCPIEEYDETDVAKKIIAWMDRSYDFFGNGNIFTIPKEYEAYIDDQRELSTWDQMYAYTWTMGLVSATDEMIEAWKRTSLKRKQQSNKPQ